MTDRPPGFEVERTPLAGAPGVIVRGELDISTAPRLAETLDAEIRATHGTFVVDLCELEFLDSTGVSVLVRARAMLGRDERVLLIVCPPGPTRRIFEIAGITDLFALVPSRDEAAAALRT